MKLTHLLAPLLLATAAAFAQGPLAPSGAPAPTMKSLDQIFTEASTASAKAEKRTPISALPFAITQPGSYYLTGNLTATAGGPAITNNATSDAVTLDLNGFTLDGNNVGGTAIFNNSSSKVVVLNGAVTRWPEYAVFAYGPTALSDLVLDSTYGVALADAMLRRCTITQRQESGYALTANTMDVRECSIRTVAAGALGGVNFGAGAIANCTISSVTNTATAGSVGLTMGSGSATDVQISGFATGVRSSTEFTGRGLKISYVRNGMNFGYPLASGHLSGFKVSDSSISTNGLGGSSPIGINVVAAGFGFDFTNIRIDGYYNAMSISSGGGQIRDCSIANCVEGIRVTGAGAIVSGCTLAGDVATGYGVEVGTGSAVRGCTVVGFFTGIQAGADSQVLDCIATNQYAQGIYVGSSCTVRGNTCKSSTGRGIVANGPNNHIEGNHLDFATAPTGNCIFLSNLNNIVIRNSIQGGASPIYSSSGPASGPGIAPLQNPATSTNPNANLSY